MTAWTKPYYGVQHMTGLKPGYQATVTKLGDGVYTATVFAVGTPNYFGGYENREFPDAFTARSWSEKHMRGLGALP